MTVHHYRAAAAKAAVSLALSGAGLLLFATPAFAGVGIGVAPNFPGTVIAGQTNVAVSMDITNNSNGGVTNIDLTSIKLVPQCGDFSIPCSGAAKDPGVFSVSASGTGGGACAANTFTIAQTDATNGEVTFTPNATITLAPAQTCTINFTVNVLKVPTKDATAIPGTDTVQGGSVTAIQTGGVLPGSGTGTDITTVSKAAPSISTTPSAGGPVGTTLNDTATLTGGSSPTGNVTFKLFPPSDANCSLTPSDTEVDGTAPYATSVGFVSNAAGVWHWTADYAGDANNVATSSGCTAEPVTVTKVAPTIATTLSTTTAVQTGSSVHDSAALTGATASAAGSATYSVYSDNACTLNKQDAGTVTVASHLVPDSNPITFNTAGTFYWQVVYSGDANNSAATSTCGSEVLTVSQPQGHIIVDKVTNPSGATQSFTFSTTGTGYTGFSLTDAAAPNNQTLAPGTYSVTEASTTGWDFTGATCSLNGGTGGPYTPGAPLTLNGGDTISCVFTNTERGSISGMKFNDLDGNGVKGGTEPGLSGWTIGISSGGATTTTVTDGSGNYSFTNLVAGNYLVCEVQQAGWTQTAPSTGCFHVTLAAGQSSTGSDFGNHQVVIQYCSPGYWKQPQHFHSYTGGFTPSELFVTAFGVNAFPGQTLVQVLSNGGGGLNAYGRAAVGALLNAAALTTGLTPAQVISKFDATFAGAPSGNANGYYGSANPEFTAPESCPLN